MKTPTFWSQFKIILLIFVTALIPKFIGLLDTTDVPTWLTVQNILLACSLPVLAFIMQLANKAYSTIYGQIKGWQWWIILLTFVIAFIPILEGWFTVGLFPTEGAMWWSACKIALQPVLYFILTLTQNSQGDLLSQEKYK